jgi:hypothetical protein
MLRIASFLKEKGVSVVSGEGEGEDGGGDWYNATVIKNGLG